MPPRKNNSNNKYTQSRRGLVFAVASGARPGIYFRWNDPGGAEEAIRGISQPQFQSFSSIAEAERYLNQFAPLLMAPNTGGWISTNKARQPILYQRRQQQQSAAGMMTIPPIVSMESGDNMQDETTNDDSSRLTTSKYFGPQEGHQSPAQKKKRAAAAVAAAVVASPSRPQSSPTKRQRSNSKTQQTKIKIKMRLDACQQRAVDAAMNNQNVFLTGVAGTGKSLVTKMIYEQALERFGGGGGGGGGSRKFAAKNSSSSSSSLLLKGKRNKKVALCAPTGMAAVGLGLNGQTIHTLAGVKVPMRASDFNTMRSPANEKKWKALECLIIDEVGMLSADFLDFLDWNVRQIRRRPLEPFGGIQLIFVGDFAQLGPVPGSLSLSKPPSRTGPPYPPQQAGADCFLNIHETTAFCFQSALWREADFCHVHLTEVYRQTDRDFVQALMDLREQRPESALVKDLVQKCSTSLEDTEARKQVFGEAALEIPPGLLPTLLYTNNKNADRENAERLASLNTPHKRFVAEDSVQLDDEVPSHVQGYVETNLNKNKFFDQCQATKNLDLKIGAQVMLVQNISTEDELVNGSRGVVEKFVLVPVLLDFKGTEERVLGPDDTDLFPEGKTYEQLDFHTVFHFKDKTWKMCRKGKYPLVRFLNNKTKIIVPTTFERTLFRQGTCRRVQLPLRLSWALTIHKAQGCTLDWLICDLAGCFTAGQAYVALSRAKSMAGLQIRNFSPRAVLTNPLVDGFYQALAANTVSDFLRDQAGLWWYPILDHPEWFHMFTEASSTANARANSEQFRHWVADYRPSDNYQGWKGYNEQRPSTMVRSPLPTSRTTAAGYSSQQHRTVTPTGVQTTLYSCFQKKAM